MAEIEEKIASLVREKGGGAKLGVEEEIIAYVDSTIPSAYWVVTRRKRRVGGSNLCHLLR